MTSILIRHAIKILSNKRNPVTHLLSKSEINILFSHWGMKREDTENLLAELKQEGHVKFNRNGRGACYVEVLDDKTKG